MRQSFVTAWPTRGLALAVTLSLVACVATPTAKDKSSVTTRASAGATTKTQSPAPAAVPSLGLLLDGQVAVDPSALLANKLVEKTAAGVKLLSDNGLGLIANNGGGLLSDNGLGLIANNSAGFRVLQASPAAAASGSTLKPVEGMWVKAVSLYDGKLLAGPVATNAEGRYKLGFLNAPARNIRIVAEVPLKVPDERFAYATLIPPKPASVVTNDSTRAITRYILGVLPARIQPYLEMVKAGNPPEIKPKDEIYEKRLKETLAKIAPAKMIEADKKTPVAMAISERMISFADLTMPIYQEFYGVTEEIRTFGEAIQPAPEVSLIDQVMKLAGDKETHKQIPDLLKQYGMSDARATDVAARLEQKGVAIAQLVLLVMLAQEEEVFAPLKKLVE
ncbi:hypothetical protein D3C72_423310 [compost metagenome]